jgi:DNA-binding XRE family transcriptional regulator
VLKQLGRRIRELRLEQGHTSQEKFADFCGVDRSFMGHLETGRRDFRLSTITKIAEALDVPIAELFLEPGSGRSAESKPKPGANLERKRVLETAATLEAAAQTLRQVVGISNTGTPSEVEPAKRGRPVTKKRTI